MTKAIVLLAWAAAIGLVAGILLDVVTFLVARYGPQADSWSFRGNGALAVPFGLGPAILAAAWVALVVRYRGFANWKELGLAAGLVGTGLLLLSVLVLVAFGSAALIVSSAITLLILGWMIVAPVLAGFIHARSQLREGGPLGGHIGAGAVFALVLIAAFYASGIVLAPGS